MTGRRFWGASARPRGPALTFVASSADRSKTLGGIQASVAEDGVEITGGMSAGSIGWSLIGEVSRHRWTLTLFVTACQMARRKGAAGIQDFDYSGRISGLTPGRYRVRVVHLYVDHQGVALGDPVVVLEQPLNIGRMATHSLLPALCWLGSLWATVIGV